MRVFLALAACAAVARAEEAISAEVLQSVAAYLTIEDETRLPALETLLKGQPFPVLERAVRESARVDRVMRPGIRDFEIEVPGTKEKSKVYIFLPEGYDDAKTWPAIVSMHGTVETGGAQDERARWMRKARGEDQFVVVCPEERPSLWGKGWGSTPAERALNLLALDEVLRKYRIDPDRVFLGGVSRGAHATWELGLLNSDRFAGLYATAGGPRLVNFGFVGNLGKLPLLEVLGAKDQAQLVDNVRVAVKRMQEQGCEVDYREYADKDHFVGTEDDRVLVEWMEKRRRDLFPRKIVHAFCSAAHARAYWVEATKLASGVMDPGRVPPRVTIPPGTKPTDAELREIYTQKIAEGLARIEAKVEGNRIDITTRKVVEIAVYFSEKLVDLNQPVEVWINGKKVHSARVDRDGMKMLRHVRGTGDRGRVFANVLKFAVP